MNEIRSDFPFALKKFFWDLKAYLDTELYFYGSVQRSDYIHNKSDIDVAIFTDNEYSTMAKLQHFLHVPRSAFDKVVWKLEGEMVYGYKIKCKQHLTEIAVYNNEFKDRILAESSVNAAVPFHIAAMLFIWKHLYYTLSLISKTQYSSGKRFLFDTLLLNKQNSAFFLIEKDEKKAAGKKGKDAKEEKKHT
jgi:predicted nucleotidyltransferase